MTITLRRTHAIFPVLPVAKRGPPAQHAARSDARVAPVKPAIRGGRRDGDLDDGHLRGGAAALGEGASVGIAEIRVLLPGRGDVPRVGVSQILLGEGRRRRNGGEDEAERGEKG